MSFSLPPHKIFPYPYRAGAERGGAAPAPALPCLSSNNCTKDEKLNILTGAHKRTAFMVAFEIEKSLSKSLELNASVFSP